MIITLTTDFGTADGFVGAMKGVILSIAPHVQVVDITHEIPPCDILAAALTLETACGYFPKGTIHIAIVDPGVGSTRSAIGVQTDNFLFVGPDNGIFELAISAELRRNPNAVLVDGRTVRLSDPSFHRPNPSDTFHGRDIFAPVAAWLANGNLLESMGESQAGRERLNISSPRETRDGLEIHVLRADRFGNLITDLTLENFQRWNPDARSARIEVAGKFIGGLLRTYSDVAPSGPLAYFGSGGRLELAINRGNAAQALKLSAGDSIRVRLD